MALEQGREVFAVPGSPLDPRCTGTNDLIRQGAVLTEKASDVLAHIHSMPENKLTGMSEPPPHEVEAMAAIVDENEVEAARTVILECLGPSPVQVDDLIRQCDLPASVVLTVLLELELAGRLERQAGHRVSLILSDAVLSA
jgi:DNA processing protein